MSDSENVQQEIVLSSPLAGLITLNKQPLSGARIVRNLTWYESRKETDSTVTDGQGRFSLPVIRKSIAADKISEFFVSQEILVQHQGQDYPIWTKAKRDMGLYAELGGRPENFSCELSNSLRLVMPGKALLVTLCKWSDVVKNPE